MNKSDLKDYMVVEYRIGELRIVINNNLYAIDDGKLREVNDLNNYDDELKSKGRHEDIVKVYDTLLVLTNKQNIKPLWERDEIDWGKVQVGTKVMVRNDTISEWLKDAIFIEKTKSGQFKTLSKYKDRFVLWKYCKLVEETKEEITLENIFEDHRAYCSKNNDTYDKCNEMCDECKIKFIINNYNITRK